MNDRRQKPASAPIHGEATPLEPLTSVQLTDRELVILSGSCSKTVQAFVAAAKSRLASRAEHPGLSPAAAGLIADAATEARTSGRLLYARTSISLCRLCGRQGGHVPFKSGPRRGEPNRDRPIRLDGIELADRFVRFQGHVTLGGCRSCIDPLLPLIAEAVRGVPAAVPPALLAEGEPSRERHDNRKCTQCGWAGHEGQMGRRRTMFGDGTYPAFCPACKAENGAFGRTVVEVADGFTVVETTAS